MKGLWCFVAGLLLMIAQSSWQSPVQETEEKARSFKASQAEPLDDPRQLNEVKRHSQGTFTSDYSKYLDTRRAQDFVQWLMNTKRSGKQNEFFHQALHPFILSIHSNFATYPSGVRSNRAMFHILGVI
uniref:Glucagon / GIP / secretin / VIP family domain-containing protein n=1 Tax=Naja naja TaxID=35670 RepID=A0A8C6XUK9_NAJNA